MKITIEDDGAEPLTIGQIMVCARVAAEARRPACKPGKMKTLVGCLQYGTDATVHTHLTQNHNLVVRYRKGHG